METLINQVFKGHDYLNEDVSFMELETPRNEKEMELLRKRVVYELGASLLRMAYLDDEEVVLYEQVRQLEKFSIWWVKFPYREDGERKFKPRPSLLLIIDIIANVPVCMYITNLEDKEKDKYDVVLDDYRSFGLKKKSAIKTDCVRHIDDVKITDKKPVGYITYDVYIKVMKTFYKFLDESLDNPYNYMNLLNMYRVGNTVINDKVKNNNLYKTQLAEDIIKTRKANCLDLAVSSHYICKKANINNRIIWVGCYTENKTNGHLITVFCNKKRKVYIAFDYDQIDRLGTLRDLESESFEDCAVEICDIAEDYLSKGIKGPYNKGWYVFDKEDIKVVDDANWVRSHTQQELLNRMIYKKKGLI